MNECNTVFVMYTRDNIGTRSNLTGIDITDISKDLCSIRYFWNFILWNIYLGIGYFVLNLMLIPMRIHFQKLEIWTLVINQLIFCRKKIYKVSQIMRYCLKIFIVKLTYFPFWILFEAPFVFSNERRRLQVIKRIYFTFAEFL